MHAVDTLTAHVQTLFQKRSGFTKIIKKNQQPTKEKHVMRSDEQITLPMQGRVEEKCTCQDPDHTPVTQLSSQMDSTGQEMTSHAGNKRRIHLIKANHC